MPETRRSISHTTIAAALLFLQLALVPRVSRAQEGAATAPEPAQADSVVAAPPSPAPVPAEPVAVGPAGPGAAPYVLWGASAVSLALGTVFGVMALSANHDYDEQPTYGHATRVHNLGIAADVGLGLGLLLAITGTVFFFADRKSDAPERTPSADSRSRAERATPAIGALRLAPLLGHHTHGGTLALRF